MSTTSDITVSDTDLIDEDSPPEFFHEFDDLSRISSLVEDSRDLSLLRQF